MSAPTPARSFLDAVYFTTPYTKAVRYSSPSGKGVYTKPHTEANPAGWGEPRRDPSGAPIIPGTPGGPSNRTLVAERDGAYRATSSKFLQASGNITWWGELLDEANPDKGRRVLSCHGPKLRYFRDTEFFYGSDPSHNEIYYRGNYAAIAPGPVLGAAARKVTVVDDVYGTTSQEYFIYAVVYRNGSDEFYRKRWGLKTMPAHSFTDSAREAEMATYDAVARPFGWELLFSHPRQSEDHYAPETPWFFNKSCTEALCVRRKKIKFDNGYGSDVEEEQFERWKASIGDTAVSVNNLGSSQPMEFKERAVKTQPLYTSVDIEGHTHEWQEDHVTVDITLQGEHYVMGDYLEDVAWWGKVKYSMIRRHEEYFTKGIDPASYEVTYQGEPINISNEGLRVGPVWHDFYTYGFFDESYVESPADHEATRWLASAGWARLYLGPEGDSEQLHISLYEHRIGTRSEWEGREEEPDDPSIFFSEFTTQYFRGMFDLRTFSLFVYEEHTYGLYQDGSSSSTAIEVTTVGKSTLYSEHTGVDGEDYRSVKESSEDSVWFGWQIADMESWPSTIDELSVIDTYTGAWPKDNNTGDEFKPGNKTFYIDTSGVLLAGDWPTIADFIYGPWTVCKGNGVSTELGEVCFSVEVPDRGTAGPYVPLSDHKPGGKLEDIITFGDRFYPIGAC